MASKSVRELILDNNGLEKEINETADFFRSRGQEPPLFSSTNLENHMEKAKDKEVEISDGFSPLNRSHRDFADEDEKHETDSLLRKAKMYQDYMKQVPIPTCRSSLIPFTTWVGLGISIKQLYGQPLHYLTNVLLHRWDQSRLGTDAEDQILDTIIHPSKAEATIWLIEEVHRLTSSHLHIAHLWQSDPMYHAFVDPIFPKV